MLHLKEQDMYDMHFAEPNGWVVYVRFTTPRLHCVKVVASDGRTLPLGSSDGGELCGLTESQVADLTYCVKKFSPNESEKDALAKITSTFN